MTTRQKKIDQSSKLEYVRLGQMRVPELAQRDLRTHKVNQLLADFDLDQLGVPVISFRGGYYYILDGQHRVEALKAFLEDDWEDQQLQCEVYRNLSEAEEAEKFLRRNDNLQINSFDKFRISVNAKWPTQVSIKRTVERAGLKVSRDNQDGAVGCVGTLQKVWRRTGGDPTLGRALLLCKNSFGNAGLNSQVIDGMGHLCQRYNGVLNDADAVSKLNRMSGGVAGLLNRAELLKQKTGAPKAECIAAAAVDTINRGKGGKKLPGWFSA